MRILYTLFSLVTPPLLVLQGAALLPLVPCVAQVQQSYRAGRRHQEHHIEPSRIKIIEVKILDVNMLSPVIEVELEIPEDLCDDGPVLRGHVHPHQHHHGHEVHPHDLREEQNEDVGTL